jgi:hypothetical protein
LDKNLGIIWTREQLLLQWRSFSVELHPSRVPKRAKQKRWLRFRMPLVMPDTVVLTNTKDGRTIGLAGAVNCLAESSELVAAASLLKELKPQAALTDINEHVFQDFGIHNRV